MKELKFKEGDVIPIETVILVLEGGAAAEVKPAPAGAAPSPAPAANQKPALPPMPAQVRPTPTSAPVSAAGVGGLDVYPPVPSAHVLATPATRRLARESGVDLNQVRGTGLAGRVTREDVLQNMKSSGGYTGVTPAMKTPSVPRPSYQSSAGAAEERVAIRGVRKKIAENMQMSKHVIPHFTLMEEVRVDELVKLRAQAKAFAESKGVKVTYLPFVMKALISTCRDFPMFNASIDDAASEIVYKKYFNIGFAADTPNGLMVPVVKNADAKTVLQISHEIQELALRAREGKLALDEMKGATITITNIGSVGGVYATPIINHPEVAILGMYKIQDKPLWANERFERTQVMNFTITCDHRLIDGAVAANFMKVFAAKIENPSQLMLDMI